MPSANTGGNGPAARARRGMGIEMLRPRLHFHHRQSGASARYHYVRYFSPYAARPRHDFCTMPHIIGANFALIIVGGITSDDDLIGEEMHVP